MSHSINRRFWPVVIAVLVSVSVSVSASASGTTRLRDPQPMHASAPTACRAAILNVWSDLLRGGSPWHHELFAQRPLTAGGGALSAESAAGTVARSRGLLPACRVLTVAYVARSLALITLFGGPSALTHLRAQWSSMSNAQRSTFEQHLFYGPASSISLTLGSITILAHQPTSEKLRIAIIEHLATATATSSATVSVVRLAGRWYVSSFSSLGMNVG
ncbi:MAG: hypothetical protein ACP5OV_07630 [Acidimicrobiales bacterium]